MNLLTKRKSKLILLVVILMLTFFPTEVTYAVGGSGNSTIFLSLMHTAHQTDPNADGSFQIDPGNGDVIGNGDIPITNGYHESYLIWDNVKEPLLFKDNHTEVSGNTGHWLYSNILDVANSHAHVTRDLQFMDSPYGVGLRDTIRISFTIQNTDTISHTIGLQLPIDSGGGTSLDFKSSTLPDPPAGSISLPDRFLTNETALTGSQIPDWWQANSSINPLVLGRGTLGTASEKPDELDFINYSNVNDLFLHYNPNPNTPLVKASALLWWKNRTLAPGESITFTTYYGLHPSNQPPAPLPTPSPTPTPEPAPEPTPVIFIHGINMGSRSAIYAPSVDDFLSNLDENQYKVIRVDGKDFTYTNYNPYDHSTYLNVESDNFPSDPFIDISLNGDSLPYVKPNSWQLHDLITKYYKPNKPVVLMGYSMGASIIRGDLRIHPEDASMIKFVTFLDGVQQGSWMPAAVHGTLDSIIAGSYLNNPINAILLPIAIQNISKKFTGLDPFAPALDDLSPRSSWVNYVNSKEPPTSIPYYNFYGDIHLHYPVSVIPGIWKIKNGVDLSIGDGVLPPGTDKPTQTPLLGGEMFKIQTGHEWANHEDNDLDMPIADVLNIVAGGVTSAYVTVMAAVYSPYNHVNILGANWDTIDVVNTDSGKKDNLKDALQTIFDSEANK
jgi:pimeloyl-ACP methyl ester carboxylesterase